MNTSISNTKSIDIESDNLIIDSSHITFGEITIDSSHVYINGIQLNSNEKYQNKKELELQRKQLELISILKGLKSSCEDGILDKLLEVEEKIKKEQEY